MKKKTVRLISAILALAIGLTGIIAVTSRDKKKKEINTLEDLEDMPIGVVTDSVFDDLLRENVKAPDIRFYDSNAALAEALDRGELKAVVYDEPVANQYLKAYSDFYILEKLSDDAYGFIFQKDDAESDGLLAEFNSFILESRENGFFRELEAGWYGEDEEKRIIDRSELNEAPEKTLIVGAVDETEEVISYESDGEMTGFGIALVTEFCRYMNYGIEIREYSFSDIISAVKSGGIDIGVGLFTIDEKRKEEVNYSLPILYGSSNVVVKRETDAVRIDSLEDLNGSRVGVLTGTINDKKIKARVEGAITVYMNSTSNLGLALNIGKVDAYVTDEPLARILVTQYPGHRVLTSLEESEYAYLFKKNDPTGGELCLQMNEFLVKCREDGTLKLKDAIWFGSDESLKTVDLTDLKDGPNGTLTFATSTETGVPFAYVKDGQIVGYDIDLAAEFCRQYGYGIKIIDLNFAGLISAVESGIADFAASCVTVTEERAQSVLFSDANYKGGIVVVVKDQHIETGQTFFERVKDSFVKTFIREKRWKVFLTGIRNTLLITMLSLLLGTILGFMIMLILRKNPRATRAAVGISVGLVGGMPVVVLMMLLYYIVFRSANLEAITVSIIGFSFTFGCSVFSMLVTAVDTVDRGQYEAAYSLGFNDFRAFVEVIMPQALRNFLPQYRSEIITHIKATSIVGFIAVQDLTKASDIIRAATMEPVFPLIFTALIYYAVEVIFLLLVERIRFRTDLRRRKASEILKGIKTYED